MRAHWPSSPCTRNRTRDAPGGRSTSCDESIQWTERAQRRESDEVKTRHAAFEPRTQNGNPVVSPDYRPERRIDHRQPGEIDLVSCSEENVIDSHLRAVRKHGVDFAVYLLTVRYCTPFPQRDFPDDSIPQPIGRTGFIVAVVRVLPFLGELVEEIREMVQHPVVPPGADAGIGCGNPFQGCAHVRPIRLQPENPAADSYLHGSAGFVQQRGILDGALSATDHHDVAPFETAEVTMIGGMRDEA